MHEIKQIIYIVAVIVLMIVAARYMKKIKDKPDEIPEETDEPLPEDDVEIDETAEQYPDTAD